VNTESSTTVPAVIIQVGIEDARPRVGVDCVNEAEAARLADWINSQPDLQELVAFALSLDPREVAT
jgi:hypothetical protein